MIEQLISEIISAEKEAEAIEQEANEQARKLSINGEKQIEAMRIKKIAEAERRAEEIAAAARKEGARRVEGLIKKAKPDNDKMQRTAQKNMEQASIFIAESVLKEYGNR